MNHSNADEVKEPETQEQKVLKSDACSSTAILKFVRFLNDLPEGQTVRVDIHRDGAEYIL